MRTRNKGTTLWLSTMFLLLAMLITAPAYADDTGYKYPTSYVTGTTGNPPSHPELGRVDDVATGATDDASCAEFKTDNRPSDVADSEIYYDFSLAVPSGATIDGIEVVVSGYRTGAPSVGAYFSVRLSLNGGVTWTDSNDTSDLTATDAEYTLGSSGWLWGDNWTPDSFSDAQFGLEIIPDGPFLTGEQWKLDSVSVKVYYTLTSADLTGQFRTQTQGGWGAEANGNNPGSYRDANFGATFPDGLLIGDDIDGDWAEFTSAAAIEAFLPAGGTAGTLGDDYTDPTTTSAGVLAGQVVALTLNVGFDLYDPDFSASTTNLRDLVIVDSGSPCYGWTVEDVLDEANNILAGGSSSVTPSDINVCVSSINQNFENGNTDGGFLGLP